MVFKNPRVFRVVVIAALIAVPMFAHAQSEESPGAQSWEWMPLDRNTALIFGSTGFDYVSTKIAEGRGFREVNPLVGTNRYQQIGAMFGSAWLSAAFSGYLDRQGHPKLAQVLRSMKIGLHLGFGVHNLRSANGR